MGELYHRLGALLPPENTTPSYAQLYIYDPAEARDFRMARNPGLDATTMSDLQDMMLEHNPFVHQFKQAQEIMQEQPEQQNLQVCLTYKAHNDPCHYNLPTTDEIAVILPGDGALEGKCRDIILHQKDGGLKRISDYHPTYAPLHYVLLFPRGELGWHWNIPIRGEIHDGNAQNTESNAENPDGNVENPNNPRRPKVKKKKTVSQINYWAYHLFQRH